MTEKPQQESFLAQLSEVEVSSVSVQSESVEVLHISPVFDAKVDGLAFRPASNYMKPEDIPDPGLSLQVETQNTDVASFVATSSTTVSSEPTNGNAANKIDDPPRTSNPVPQTVTGNVKIQLMEISVDEFKANVEYIQQQFPSLPRRLVCDAFSKANFDCSSAMEILAKEQEKKDQTIVPPMVAAAAAAAAAATSKHQQQMQQNQRLLNQASKLTATTAAAEGAAVDNTAAGAAGGAAGSTPAGAAAVAGQSPAVATTQTPRAASLGGRTLPLPHVPRSRRSAQAGTPKEDPCYRRVVSADKDAERALRQKLKSHVRSRVFSHGVKISQGRETAETVHQQHLDGENQELEAIDSPTSPDDAAASGRATMTPTSVRVLPSPTAARSTPGRGGRRLETDAAPIEDDGTPQSALRILRDSFPSLDEARIAETLTACDQDVDAAIRVLSGRPLVPGGADESTSKFFKSRTQQQAAARRSYVRSELNTGAWMDQKAAAALSKAGGGASPAAGGGGRVAAGLPGAASLKMFATPPKKRIKNETFTYK